MLDTADPSCLPITFFVSPVRICIDDIIIGAFNVSVNATGIVSNPVSTSRYTALFPSSISSIRNIFTSLAYLCNVEFCLSLFTDPLLLVPYPTDTQHPTSKFAACEAVTGK